MKKIIVSSMVLMFAFAGGVHAAGNAEAGKTKAAACGGCHGLDGNSLVPTFPKLAGQGEKYIAKQVMAEHGIEIHDMYGSVKPHMETLMLPNGNVHFTKEGSEKLGGDVADVIMQALQKKVVGN